MNTAAAWCMAFDISSVTPGGEISLPYIVASCKSLSSTCALIYVCKSQVTPLTSIKLLE